MENLTEYLETYHEIAVAIERVYDKLGAFEEDPFEGHGGRWEKAKEWTDEFEETHKETDWTNEDNDWFDILGDFVNKKINELRGEN